VGLVRQHLLKHKNQTKTEAFPRNKTFLDLEKIHTQKQKFNLWCHSKIVELTQQRWNELGGKVVFVNPKYTSAYAFDGSGKVRRSKINYYASYI
jgi:hypothetical protein